MDEGVRQEQAAEQARDNAMEPDPSLSQADLEAAIAWVNDAADDENRHGRKFAAMAVAALTAASRQPVSGLEGDLVAELDGLRRSMIARKWPARAVGTVGKAIAALSRVPADGEQPECTCPTTIGGERVENLSCPIHGEQPAECAHDWVPMAQFDPASSMDGEICQKCRLLRQRIEPNG